MFPICVVIVVFIAFYCTASQNWKSSGCNRVLIHFPKFVYGLSPDGGEYTKKVAAAAASRARLCCFTCKPSAELLFVFVAFLSVTCYTL